ncbi:MAG: SIS domain-containing protein [Promethearchaeota archaeon]
MDTEKRAEEILQIQQKAVLNLKITSEMELAIESCIQTGNKGMNIITSGMGKAGIIAQKMSATLCSIGLNSFFIHPAEALHGDIGRINSGDLIIVFSNSGSTREIILFIEALDLLNSQSNKIVCITNNPKPQFRTNIVVTYKMIQESCIVPEVPSTSTTLMLIIADVIAITAAEKSGLEEKIFRLRHPGGAIGEKYKK